MEDNGKKTPTIMFRTPLLDSVEIIHAEVFVEREEEQRKDFAAAQHPSEESCTDTGEVACSEEDPGPLEQWWLIGDPSETPPCGCDCCRRWLSRRPAPSLACGMTFPSYHALCGHMASQYRKQQHDALSPQESCYRSAMSSPAEGISRRAEPEASQTARRGAKRAKIADSEHRCNVCGRVFPTGQALGGHKRLHWQVPETSPTTLLLFPPPAAATAEDYCVVEKVDAGTAAGTHYLDLNETVPVVEDGTEAANGRELLLLF